MNVATLSALVYVSTFIIFTIGPMQVVLKTTRRGVYIGLFVVTLNNIQLGYFADLWPFILLGVFWIISLLFVVIEATVKALLDSRK
jgi:hypothetical protein